MPLKGSPQRKVSNVKATGRVARMRMKLLLLGGTAFGLVVLGILVSATKASIGAASFVLAAVIFCYVAITMLHNRIGLYQSS